MRVAKWGNSLAVRLPAALVKELDLKEGSDVELQPVGRGELVVSRKMSRQEAVASLRELRVKLPKSYKFDREDANAR